MSARASVSGPTPPAGAGLKSVVAPAALATRRASVAVAVGISCPTRTTSARSRPSRSSESRTCSGSSALLAPPATAMQFSPAASTRISATPVAWSGSVRSSVTSTPSTSKAARAAVPKSSVPTAPTKTVAAPRRAAATAWFPPLPPWCWANRAPVTVSPGAGRWSSVATRSSLTEPTTITLPVMATSRAGDVLAAVHADDVAVDELGAVSGQRQDRVRDVLRRRHSACRVPLHRDVDHRLRLGDLEQRRGDRDARPDAVRRRTRVVAGKLHRELTDVRFERRLGRRHHAVRRHDPRRALRRHRVDLGALSEEAAAPQVLDPVDKAVGHDILGHLHLLAVDAAFRVLGQERHERAEGEGVHHDADVRLRSEERRGGTGGR